MDDCLGGVEDPFLGAHHHSPPEPAPMDPSNSFLDPRASSGMLENKAMSAAAEELETVSGKTGQCTSLDRELRNRSNSIFISLLQIYRGRQKLAQGLENFVPAPA